MNIIFSLTLVVCLFDLSVAARLRENLNVLVPNNDVNLHAKIKTLLSGDEVDPEDFSDSEIESLSEMKDPDIQKLRHKEMRNEVLSVSKDTISGLQDNSNLAIPPEFNLSSSTLNRTEDPTPSTPDYSSVPTLPSTSYTTPPVKPSFDYTNMTTFPTTPSPTTPFYTSRMYTPDMSTTNSTTLSATSTDTNVTFWSSENQTQTTNNWSRNWSSENQTQPTMTSSIYGSTTTDNAISSSTAEYPDPSELQSDECLLGTADRYLPWLNKGGGLIISYINSQFGDVNYTDLSWNFNSMQDYEDYVQNSTFRAINFSNLRFLSASYNKLNRLPYELLKASKSTLEYLCLAGNNLTRVEKFQHLPELKVLDLRKSRIEELKKECFEHLHNLGNLYLAYNYLTQLNQNVFPPGLLHLDLSHNFDNTHSEGLSIDEHAFRDLKDLQRLDLSHTKLHETKCLHALYYLSNLDGLSLCSTDLPGNSEIGFKQLSKLKYFDISGNARLQLNEKLFANFSDTLQVLFAKNSSRQNLDWTKSLKNLRILDLFNSNIYEVKSNSFSHMTYLTTLNLEKNAIGNWYSKLFAENQHLETLNLRDNKLTLLTEDMKEDFMSVQFVAIGKNDFECNCVLQDFMKEAFEATKGGNVTRYLSDKETDLYVVDNEIDEKVIPDTTRVSLGVRNYLRPEYDVMSRTYQKYYQMAAQSVQAMKIRTSETFVSRTSKSLIMMSKVLEPRSLDIFQTILFDYDEDYDDYTCWNARGKQLQQIIDLQDLCEKELRDDSQPPYEGERQNELMALWISLPTVIIVSGLLLVIYWKWWYIKYFFVLCKNSAILTFMDDSDGGKEKVCEENSEEPVEAFLYDAFVSYCEHNREWVLDEFIPNVERRESINVCLHERDFQVGYGILENIVSCMDRSKCLLLVISESFLLSQWCQFEMNLAQHRLLETRREKLIIVLLEDIPVRKQPKTLKYLMRTKTYIKWPQNGSNDERAIFWKRLKKAIISSKWETDSYGSIV